MPSWRPTWSEPRTWFLTVRLLEISVVVLLVGGGLALYHGWRQISLSGPTGIDGEPNPLSLAQKLALTGAYASFSGSGSAVLVVGAVLVLASVVVLHRVRPVSQARLLRWEVAAVGGLQLVMSLLHTVGWVVAGFAKDPYGQEGTITEGDRVTTVDVYNGPSQLENALMSIGLPLTSLVLVAVAALWWMRLPAEFDAEDETGELAADGAAAGSAPTRRRWRPAPAPDANLDDIVLDGVEQIEPVERLRPRDDGHGDGSTSSGYEDYFRRF